MFNKKLIAGGILAVASSAALAAPSFDFVPGVYSSQGSASQTNFVAPDMVVMSGAELSNDDLITVAWNSAFTTGTTPPSNVYMYATCKDQADGTQTAAENGGVITLGRLTNDANSVTYRVTDMSFAITTAGAAAANKCKDKAVENSTVGAVWTYAGASFDGAALRAAGSLTGTYHATLPNGSTDIDGGFTAIADLNGAGVADDKAALVTFQDQFVLDVTALAADGFGKTIDVTMATDARSDFTDNTGSISTDVLTIQLNEVSAGVAKNDAVAAITTAVVTGDFSFIVDEDTDTAGLQNNSITATVEAANAASVTLTASSITVVGAATKVGDIVITFDNNANGDGKQAMVAGSFTSAVSVAYTDAGVNGINDNGVGVAGSSVESTANSAGSWDLNGSNSVVEAYPVSAGVTQFLWVTNTGSEAAGISVTAKGDGAKMATCDVGTVAANDLEYIADDVKTCLDAASFGTDRVQLTVTVNAAKSTIDVYAGYKVDADADRLALTVVEL